MPSLAFLNPFAHGFVRVAVAVPRMRVADPAFNAARDDRAARAGRRRRARSLVAFPELGLSAYTCDDLFHQRALLDACEAALGARRRGDRSGSPRDRHRRPAAARRPPALQLRRGRRRRPRPRRRAEDLPAELRRVLRGAPVQRRATTRCRARSTLARRRRAVRHRPALRGGRPAAAARSHVEICEDVWVPIPPSSLRRAGRRDGARQPVGIEHHDRQGRLPAPARRAAVGALPRGLPVHVGRRRRVDHRPGLGRPGADLRERRPARRVGALRRRLALDHRRRRPRARLARAHAAEQLRPVGRDAQGASSAASARVALRAAAADGAAAARCGARSSASPTCRPTRRARDERCAEVYNIQVAGAGAAAARPPASRRS